MAHALQFRTVSHFKRASNHNTRRTRRARLTLFHISKEHQITTSFSAKKKHRSLFHISKEHQITTRSCASAPEVYCFTFQKSIKSQPRAHSRRGRLYCFTFQKSIKSQHSGCVVFADYTVSHFKRASNHNVKSDPCSLPRLFHISKEHQITTRS